MAKALAFRFGLAALVAACLSFGLPAYAQSRLLPACTPGPVSNGVSTPEDADALACIAQNKVTARMEPIVDGLATAGQALTDANNRRDWTAYRAAWNKVLPSMKALRDVASENAGASGAANVSEAYGEGIGFDFKNEGLPAVGTLEDASAAILKGLEGPQGQVYGTAGIALVNQLAGRSVPFAVSLANAAGEARRQMIVNGQDPAQLARAKTISAEENGDTAAGYFGGFGHRLRLVAGPWAFFLFVVCLVGHFVAKRTRRNPHQLVGALALAYMPASVVMVLLLLFAPFLGGRAILAVTVVLMAVTYFNGPGVFGGIARCVGGSGTETGRRLIALGNAMRILRGQPAGHAAQAAPAPSPAPIAADKATHGTARFATPAELASKGHLVPPDRVASAGLALARVPGAPAGLDPRYRHAGHVVTVAPTGSGKGIGQVIPNLLDYPGSMLVVDPKGENVAVTCRARRQLGQRVHVVDPFAASGRPASAFNVLDRLDVASPDCVSLSAELADALVIPADAKAGGDGAHFDDTARTLLQGLMLHLAGQDDPARRHLGELRRMIGASEDELLELWATMAAEPDAAYGIPARAANTIMGVGDKERGSMLSTLRRHTAFLDDPRIAAALARSDFDLDALKGSREGMTVYLVLPANRIGPNARFLRLFIGATIAAVTASPAKPAHDVVLLLDEFGQLSYLKQLEDAVSLMRGYGLAFWVFLQDLSQLKGVYPRWQTFLANAAKVFFGTDDYDTAKYISDSLGQSTIEFETANTGSNTGSSAHLGGAGVNRGRSEGTSQQLAGRALLTPDEVMRLGPERPLVLVKGEYPCQLARLNYLADAEYAGRFDPNPYH